MPQSVAIVSAADATSFSLLVDLLSSIRDQEGGRDFPVCVLDVGLEAEQRAWLVPRVREIKAVGWDLDFPDRAHWPDRFKSVAARPFLPMHFPGYDLLLWLSNDLWVQDWRAIEAFVLAGEREGFGIVAAVDRAYGYLYNKGNVRRANHTILAGGFDKQIADTLAPLPIMNSGAFILRSESPIWHAWQGELSRALQKLRHLMIEQVALNVTIYAQPRLPHLLPSLFNWLCAHALPAFDPRAGALVEPFLPHQRLGIVQLGGHLSHQSQASLALTGGGSVVAPLTYRAFKQFSAAFRPHGGEQ